MALPAASVALATRLVAAEAAPPAAPAKLVWVEGKRLAKQSAWHFAYASVSALEPSPWSHFAAHSLVAAAWEELGRAIPWQAAWQVTSAGSQFWIQLIVGLRLALAAGALVMEADSWGKARTPAAKARMAIEYFMVNVVWLGSNY